MSMFTYTQKTNEVYADTENTCYSDETVEFNALPAFFLAGEEGRGALFGD